MTRIPFNTPIAPARPALDSAPVRPPARESVEQYLARGGVVEVLPGVGAREAA